MTARVLMLQGTGSDVGKSVLTAALCRIARQRGLRVAPFKPQNMSNNAAVCDGGGEIGRAQALQALASGIQTSVDLNPVLLKPQSDTVAQVVVHGKPVEAAEAADYIQRRGQLLGAVVESFDRLVNIYDIVFVEGAGSASETNLREADIANMGFAQHIQAPVCLVGDIDRGGVIASIVGTKAVLDETDSRLITGFLINKFRGDPDLFADGVVDIERRTGWLCHGVIPWIPATHLLPAEDSVPDNAPVMPSSNSVKIVAPILSRMANFDDADPLRQDPHVDFQWIDPGVALPRDADVVILFGSKSTIGDLGFFREQGWHHDLMAHVRHGGRVLGICGGYQMLGKLVRDPLGVDGEPGEQAGLSLLDVTTTMSAQKSVRQTQGHCTSSELPVTGYEIHAGSTVGIDCSRPLWKLAQEPEGATSANGRIQGTYLHGLMSNDRYRAYWLSCCGAVDATAWDYSKAVEQALDDLACGVSSAVDVDALFNSAATPRYNI